MSGICTDGLVYQKAATLNSARLNMPGSSPKWPLETKFVLLSNEALQQTTYAEQQNDKFPRGYAIRSPDSTIVWRVDSFGLIGLWNTHPEGAIVDELYLLNEEYERNESFVEKREASLIEQQAIESFDNNDLYAEYLVDKGGSRIRFVSAIRAESSCLKCHKTDQGRLLGAFTLELF